MTLSFDIETVAQTIDEEMAAAVVDGLDADKAHEALDRLALSPFTGAVAVIAAWDDVVEKGICFTNGPVAPAVGFPPGFVMKCCADERALLTAFWDVCSRQRRFATFNGNNFDVPFLVGRSVALDVRIHRALIETKPWDDVHVDMRKKLELGWGDKQRSTFDVVCRALGVESPKSDIKGSEVGEQWAGGDAGRSRVANYCCRDVGALVACLKKWDRCATNRGDVAPSTNGSLL